MTRAYLALTVLLAFWLGAAPLAAKHSDGFMLGVYSSINNSTQEDRALRDTLCSIMHSLGYNATTIKTRSDDTGLPGLFQIMDKYGLDAIINDFAWNKSLAHEHRFASHTLAISNYARFEAEYASEAELRPGDRFNNQFWYAARSEKNQPRVGNPLRSAGSSNGWSWQARTGRDNKGYLLTDLRYRWPNRNGFHVRFGAEFMLFQNDPSLLAQDHIWVKFRFRVTDVQKGLKPEDPLLRFYLAGYEFAGSGFASQPQVLDHIGKEGKAPETILRAGDLAGMDDPGVYQDLWIRVSYADLLDARLLTFDHDLNPSTPDSRDRIRLVNLNPRVWWYGNCNVELDYVEIEDQIHHDLRSDSDFWNDGIRRRMRSVIAQSEGNVKAFYSFDEPLLGQFDSFRLIQEAAAEDGIEYFTAVYDHQHKNFVLDKQRGIRYDHVDAFRKLARPRIIAPDIYPLTPDLDWSPGPRDDGRFIQDVLDATLIRTYRESKLYRDAEQGRKFYPIVQVLGGWAKRDSRQQWNLWQKPPLATQKALLYLPLCFGPDGILHYSLRSVQTSEGYGHHVITNSQTGSKNYPYPSPDPVIWPAVSSTNPRVKEYGLILLNLDWLGSESIGTTSVGGDRGKKQALLGSLLVLPSGEGDYEGYVQCAYYRDSEGNPQYMIVNRRGNYFAPDIITEARYVPDAEYDKYFPEAGPQVLRLTFSSAATRRFGKNLLLYDPYAKVYYPTAGKSAEISLPAGEGRLLQLFGTLPPQTKGRHKIDGTTVVSGDVTLQKCARVTLDKNSHLILMPGTTLTVGPKSRLLLKGKVTLMENAKIIVRGNLKDESVRKELASGTAIGR
ncbi:MAG: hypothetical protein K0B87_07270 [Candidatus Syntrophosphaera sp.]|nr:hypothetical protein [Candidatus Syntrophosphaera sp.]